MDIFLEMNTLFDGRLGDDEAVSGLVIASVDCFRSRLDYANQYSGYDSGIRWLHTHRYLISGGDSPHGEVNDKCN